MLVERISADSSLSLGRLFEQLDSLTEPPSSEELRLWISALDIDDAELDPYCRFTAEGYARNLLRRGVHCEALLLCWQPGQESPIHDHGRSACVFRVITGIATETSFEAAPQGSSRPAETRHYTRGHIGGSNGGHIHRLGNEGPGNLITLHLYAPPLDDYRVF